MKKLAIARRYAKALLIIGKEDGSTDTYRKELNAITTMFESEKALRQTIANPLYATIGRRKVLEKILGKVKLSRVMNSFLLLLFDKGRVGYLAEINDFYNKLADELNGIARAKLYSATELPSEIIEKISDGLSKRTGKHILLETELDASLIGGVVTKIGDLVLDGSIKTQLLSMRESLKRGESV
jgi:F-type H+-transporting ATPase subunit delta